jgi:hypothetical protein
MGNVYEYIIDGTSGLTPSGGPSAIVVGVCSVGTVGNGYLIGKQSDLGTLLGVGPMVDRLRDVLSHGGQNPILVAVPVAGNDGGYITPLKHTGTGSEASVSGVASDNGDFVVKNTLEGALETAKYKLSDDGGSTWGEETVTAANGQVALGDSGATIVLDDGLVLDDTYAVTVRASIGPINHIGTGAVITADGTPLAGAEVVLLITGAGGRNVGTYQLSVDGDSFSAERTIPADGAIAVGTTGVIITFPESGSAVAGDTYSFDVLAPVPSISAVIDAIARPLELYDVENVYIVGASDAVDWAAAAVKAEELWGAHRPTFFLMESRLPYDGETIDEWVAALLEEKASAAASATGIVAVCAQYGQITDSTGKRLNRNWCGLLQGRLMETPVMRAPSRIRSGGISGVSLPSDWSDAVQQTLEAAGYITAKTYAGLNGIYWGEDRTLADAVSDYQYLTVTRTVYKGVRIARLQALKSLYDEAGDAIDTANAAGIAYLKANIESGLGTMSSAVPPEIAAYEVTIPEGQDIVNNGVAVEIALIGIPIIREIKLYARYVYAGSAFDPRLES